MLPVFLRFAWCDRFNRYRFRRGDQCLRLEHAANAHQQDNGDNPGEAKCRAFFRRLRVGHKRPYQRTKKGQYAKGKQAREERPEIPACIADRPDDRHNKRQCVQHNPGTTLTRDQNGADHHYDTHQRKEPGATNAGELSPQRADSQADDQHQRDKKPLQNSWESSWHVASCHTVLLKTAKCAQLNHVVCFVLCFCFE